MPPLDPEMVQPVHEVLKAQGVQLVLNDGVAGFEQASRAGLSTLAGGRVRTVAGGECCPPPTHTHKGKQQVGSIWIACQPDHKQQPPACYADLQGAGTSGLVVRTASGASFPADVALLVIGVRPETALAKVGCAPADLAPAPTRRKGGCVMRIEAWHAHALIMQPHSPPQRCSALWCCRAGGGAEDRRAGRHLGG